ncbi:AMP-binding protein [Solicola sp. PLA-1-18]|uniref:AMP-binding protein n=1 Tax=Solicola sp. PLA-1-18 TaxID=3380532 RepID=UPI003B779C76
MTHELLGPGTTRPRAALSSLSALASTGIVRPYGPRTLVRLGAALTRWGTGPAGGFASLAARMPRAAAVEDEAGSLTFAQLHEQANALARVLAREGVGEGDGVALLARNHRWFVLSTIAVSRLGGRILYLNTAFSGPQTVELLEREQPVVVLHDQEFSPVVEDVPAHLPRLLTWREDDAEPSAARYVGDLVEGVATGDLEPPTQEGRSVILTSGTTGTPKGANRASGSLSAAGALVSRIPLRHQSRMLVAAPMFHTWGWAHLNLAMLLGSTLVLRRRFDPEDFLAAVERERCEVAVVIPVMLSRVLELPADVRERYDTSSLKVVTASGSALPGDLATRWMDAFGDNLYNTYGSTECAWATIAQPGEMRARPGTAGRPPIGTVVALYDDDGEPVPYGGTGRIFVSNGAQFEGYTNGDTKPVIDGRMATGDLGRFDDGLLFVEGRDDEMIVSGGENVYPQEIEDCIARHPAVAECAVVAVDDDEWGQRLAAYVVLEAGQDADEDAIKAHVKTHLARYKVPRDVRFIDGLPRNETGKVLKRELSKD